MKIRSHIRLIIVLLIINFAALLSSCTKEYNPFVNPDNAGLYTSYKSFSSTSDVSIFTTETLEVIVTAKEQVRSFSVKAERNRLGWIDTSIESISFGDEPFRFCFSYYDTGSHIIITTVYCSDNRELKDTIVINTRNPLLQNRIVAHYGDTVVLVTPPVGDKDVSYYWSFGLGTTISAPRCSTKTIISIASLTGNGKLWVGDGTYESSMYPFLFSLSDTTPPVFACINDAYVGGDTIETGDSNFTFRVRITDPDNKSIDSVSINNLPYDKHYENVYSKTFFAMIQYRSKPLEIKLVAIDDYVHMNKREKTFYVKYNETISPGAYADFRLLVPSDTIAASGSLQYEMSGTVDNRMLDSTSLVLSLSLNGVLSPVQKKIPFGLTIWKWTVDLDTGVNSVNFVLADTVTGNIIRVKHCKILYIPGLIDTVKPIITDILSNGKNVSGLYTSSMVLPLSIRAVDGSSGIDRISVNGHAAKPDTTRLWFTDSVSLKHQSTGNEIVVEAIDGAGNVASRGVIVYLNRIPYIIKRPVNKTILTYQEYNDTVLSVDADGDSVSFTKASGPSRMNISSSGIITWVPMPSDTGLQKVTVRVWDGYQPSLINFTLYVANSNQIPMPIRFLTKESDFPTFLTAGHDSVTYTLHVAQGTGIRPFNFSARCVGNRTAFMTNSPDSVIRWKVSIADTGYRQLIIIVKDELSTSDTLYPKILVVPENRLCSLSVNYWNKTGSPNLLNVNSKQAPDTIRFRIYDLDNPLIERHSVEIYQYRSRTLSTIDSAVTDSFNVVVGGGSIDGNDTVRVIIKDRVLHADTVILPVYYGVVPSVPILLTPSNYGSFTGDSLVLSWSGSDPDFDPLTFDLYIGVNPDALQHSGPFTKSNFMFHKNGVAGTYYWRVVSSDWRMSTFGPVWRFTIN